MNLNSLFPKFGKPKGEKSTIELPKDYLMLNQSLQDFLPFSDIKDSMIKLPNGLYRAVIEVKSINYYLKTGQEQETIEMQFKSALSSWDFAFAFYSQTRTIDADEIVNRLSEDVDKLSQKELRAYGREYTAEMESLTKSKNGNLIKKYYIVISCDDANSIESNLTEEDKDSYAFDKLNLNCRKVIDSLTPIGLVCNVLSNEELIELLFVALNKHSALKANEILSFTSNLTTGKSTWETSEVDALIDGFITQLNNMMLRNHDMSAEDYEKAQELTKRAEKLKQTSVQKDSDMFVL